MQCLHPQNVDADVRPKRLPAEMNMHLPWRMCHGSIILILMNRTEPLRQEQFSRNWINHFLQKTGGAGDDDESDESETTAALD